MADRPTVTVVISTFQRAPLLDRALAALAAQTYPADLLQVVVVDDGSTDDTAAVLDRWKATGPWQLDAIASAENRGAAHGRNAGVAVAEGDVIAFTDDDCRATPQWVAALVEAFAPEVGLVQGRTLPDPAQPLVPGARSQWVVAEDGLYATCNIAYRRSVLDRLGPAPFRGEVRDEIARLVGQHLAQQPFGEDVDLGWRVKRLGVASAFAEEALVHHEVVAPSRRVAWHRAAMVAGFPYLAREVPELRATLFWRRWFLSRLRPRAWALTVGLGLLLARRPGLGAVGIGVWIVQRVLPGEHGQPATPRIAFQWAGEDVISSAALVYGTFRCRNVVL